MRRLCSPGPTRCRRTVLCCLLVAIHVSTFSLVYRHLLDEIEHQQALKQDGSQQREKLNDGVPTDNIPVKSVYADDEKSPQNNAATQRRIVQEIDQPQGSPRSKWPWDKDKREDSPRKKWPWDKNTPVDYPPTKWPWDTNTPEDKTRMNIVLLYADDWSFNTLGAMGNTYVKTPALDQLAAKGVLFSHNCVVASVCMQSRATLYTGQYSSRHQTYFSWRNVTMYEEGRWNRTLYPLMMKAGYHVGFFGKYHHLEDFPKGVPTFSRYRSTPYSHYFQRDGVVKHITQWNEEDGLQFLEERPRDQPFFLTVSFFATHAQDGSSEQYYPMNSSMHLYKYEPVPVPKTLTEKHWQALPPFFDEQNIGRSRFRGRYDKPELYQKMMKNTYRMATEVDAACGRILAKLEEQGVENNTLVIFTTDNGNFHGQHGLAEKWYAYEESLRVPLIIRDPRMPANKIGTVNEDFTLNIDLAPTMLSAAGIEPPSIMQGRDMAALYLNATQTSWRQEFLYEFWDDNKNIPDSVALVRKGFKYIYWTEYDYHEAFDLDKDPLEEFDIYNKTTEGVRAEVKQRISELQMSAKAGLKE